MPTLTETLRRGLIAKGWKRCDTHSGRECFSKLVSISARQSDGTLKPKGSTEAFIWLGSAGSARFATRNAFTESRPISAKYRAELILAGSQAGVDAEKLLNELEG